MRFHDVRTQASDPVHIRVSGEKLRQFHPALFGWKAWITKINFQGRPMRARALRAMLHEHLRFGDSRAAIAVHLSPLIVAAYTDEQDAVVLLRFADEIATQYRLKPGDRLLTVNTYFSGSAMAPDFVEGPESTGRWTNFYPIIAEFVSSDHELIERRKLSISEDEWRRTTSMALASLQQSSPQLRDGSPLCSLYPASVRGSTA